VEADAVETAEGNSGVLRKAWHGASTGVGEQGMRAKVPQEPGRSVHLRGEAVVQSEGNEAMCDG
jgi:hypothetical protein